MPHFLWNGGKNFIMCNCDLICCSNATTTDTGVVLIPNREIKNLTNANTYRMVIACNVQASSNLPVFIQTSLGNIPILCKYGNTIYANQLRTRYNYAIGYGNANDNYPEGQFVIFNRVCPRATITEAAPTSI